MNLGSHTFSVRAAAFWFALFFGIGMAQAEEGDGVVVSGAEIFEAEYRGDNGSVNEGILGDDDDFGRFKNTLYVNTRAKGFDSGLRLDALFFAGPPDRVTRREFVPGGTGYTTLDFGNDVRVERLHGTLRSGGFSVTLGDFHVSLGRGMALSLIKVDDIGEDNALRGARIEYELPRKLKAVVVGGVVNSLNEDPMTRQVLEDDPMDRILGARVEWELLDALGFGAHGVLMKPRFGLEEEVSEDRLYVDRSPGVGVATGGGSAEVHVEGIHVYIEGNGQRHDNFRAVDGAVEDETGFAAFAEAAYDLTPFSVKAEGIFYRRWLMEGPYRGSASHIALARPISYNHMVTLEPGFVPITSIGNAGGGRISGDLYVDAAELQITFKSAFIHYMGGLMPGGEWDDHPPTTIFHPILTLRKTFSRNEVSALLEGGYRYETTDEPDISGAGSGRLWHVKADFAIPLRGPHGLDAAVEVRRHELEITEGHDYLVTLETLGYHWSGLFGLTLAHEYSDEMDKETPRFGQVEWPLPDHHYAWLRGSLDVPKPLNGLQIRAFIGSERGGIKCAGGVCRRYPDSVGARLEAVYRF